MAKALTFLTAGLCGLAVVASAPARAEVITLTDAGFIVRVTAEVAASPADSWKAFSTPSLWWNPQHTFSGEAVNLTMDASANGCFCEKLPLPKDAPPAQKPGSVMHMRVVYAEPYRALRLVGGLGPLQSEAANGTMTVTFKPVDGSEGKATRILWEYVVGGFMRYKTETISGAVDKVLVEQIGGLTKLLGPAPGVATASEDFRLPVAPATPVSPPVEAKGIPVPLPAGGTDKSRIIDDGRAPVDSGRRSVSVAPVETTAPTPVPVPEVALPNETASPDMQAGDPGGLKADQSEFGVIDSASIVEVPLEPSTAGTVSEAAGGQNGAADTPETAPSSEQTNDAITPDTEVTLRKLFGRKKRPASSDPQ